MLYLAVGRESCGGPEAKIPISTDDNNSEKKSNILYLCQFGMIIFLFIEGLTHPHLL